MTAYKQIMPRLTTALTGKQKHNKIYTPLSDITQRTAINRKKYIETVDHAERNVKRHKGHICPTAV